VYIILILTKSKDLIKLIEADGWELVRVRGSHHHYKHPVKKGIVTIPHPNRKIAKGTVRSIMRQAQLEE
jgi:predicted RNA binding protein YcfA (HicA-like mRNA interferase family)